MAYADGSVDYIYSGGTVWGTFNPSHTAPADKAAVALYFSAASTFWPPIQVYIDPVCVTPVSVGQAVTAPVYGYTGEWWENDLDLLHLRARWYMPEMGAFSSRDSWEGDIYRSQSMNGWNYVEANPINLAGPSGNVAK